MFLKYWGENNQNKEKIKINVFTFVKEKTSITINLSAYLNYESSDVKIQMISPDINEFKDSYSLEYLFENFSKPEVLDNDNKWYCSRCKKHVRATKTLSIYKAPKFLTIHLKKLKMNQNKIPDITFPLKGL